MTTPFQFVHISKTNFSHGLTACKCKHTNDEYDELFSMTSFSEGLQRLQVNIQDEYGKLANEQNTIVYLRINRTTLGMNVSIQQRIEVLTKTSLISYIIEPIKSPPTDIIISSVHENSFECRTFSPIFPFNPILIIFTNTLDKNTY